MDNTPETEVTLAEVLAKYEIKLSAKKMALLEQYCTELWKWNEHLNLTRHTDYEKFVTRDLVDTIHLAEHIQKGEHVLDFGTGGGVPGVLLAILRPDITVELCDSTGKKANALGQILEAMDLNLNIWYAKGEELLKVHRFHTIIIRAVGKMEQLLRIFSPVWFAFDRLLLIKGPHWVDERGESRHYGLLNNIALRKLDEYLNPGAEHPSVILQLCQKNRLEELQKREADRLDGKPIAQGVERVGVDNKPALPDKGIKGKKTTVRSSFVKKDSKTKRVPASEKSSGNHTEHRRLSGEAGEGKKRYSSKDREGQQSKREGSPKREGQFKREGQSKDKDQERPLQERDKKRSPGRQSAKGGSVKYGKGWVHKEGPIRRTSQRENTENNLKDNSENKE